MLSCKLAMWQAVPVINIVDEGGCPKNAEVSLSHLFMSKNTCTEILISSCSFHWRRHNYGVLVSEDAAWEALPCFHVALGISSVMQTARPAFVPERLP